VKSEYEVLHPSQRKPIRLTFKNSHQSEAPKIIEGDLQEIWKVAELSKLDDFGLLAFAPK
jgi:ribosomal protein S17